MAEHTAYAGVFVALDTMALRMRGLLKPESTMLNVS